LYIYSYLCTCCIATSQLDRLCLQIEADLEAMRSARISSSSSTPEWVDRVSRREESWEEIRPTIFNEVVCLKGYPKNKVYVRYYKMRLSLHIFYHSSTTTMTNANIATVPYLFFVLDVLNTILLCVALYIII